MIASDCPGPSELADFALGKLDGPACTGRSETLGSHPGQPGAQSVMELQDCWPRVLMARRMMHSLRGAVVELFVG